MSRESRATGLALLLLLTGCSERPLPVQPLPSLVSEAPHRTRRVEISPLWFDGEQLSWDVSWRGVSVGRAHLATGLPRVEAPSRLGRTVRSRFRTHGFAARLAVIRHDLATDEADPRAARDRAHTLHSAIATLRAWSLRDRPAGFLTVDFDEVTYRLDVTRPVHDAAQLRVDCQLLPQRPRGHAMAITVWLTDDALRVPTRVEIEDRRGRVTADLIERTL